MTANPSWLESPSPQTTPTQPSWLETPKPQQQPQWLQTPEPSQKQGPQPPYGINNPKGGIFGVNPSINVMGDFNTNIGGFNTPGIRPEFRSIVTQLANDGNRMGVYDFNRGHHYAPNDPHLDGRAMDVDTINGEPVGVRLSPNLGQFISQALAVDPRVRLGVPKEIYQQLGGLTGNGRIFVDDPAHIHVEFDPGAMYQHQQAAAAASPSPKWLAQTTPKPSAQPSPKATASPLPQHQEAGFAQAIANAASTVEETGKGFFKEQYYEQEHPQEMVTDVFGTLQRGVAGYLSQTDPTGKAWITPPTPAAVGMAIYDAFHPHSQDVHNRDNQAAIRSVFAPLGIKEADKGTWAHYGQLVAAQTATDPTQLLPMLGPLMHGSQVASIMGDLAKSADAVPAVRTLLDARRAMFSNLANNAVSQGVKELFGARPELHEMLDDHAYGARIVIEHGANNVTRPLEQADDALLREHEQMLRGLTPDANGVYHLPEAVQQRYLMEPYIFGTPEMRQQALQLGYKPTEAQMAQPPLGLLKYNLQKDYQTFIRAPQESVDDATARVSGGRYSKAPSGFELSRKGDKTLGDDQFDITANRLRLGRNLIRSRIIDNQTEAYLAAHGGWKPGVPHDITQLSNKAWSVNWAPGKFMKQLANESIKAFPFPHEIGNVGPLAFAGGGGWTAIGLALKHMVTGLTKEQAARLQTLGLLPEYIGRDMDSPWTKPPLTYMGGKGVDKAIEVSSKILNRMEGGFRQAYLDLADHQHGFDPKNLQNEYAKAKAVFDAMGDYENTSKIVKVLGGVLGAPFVAFGLSVVPKAIWNAILHHPEKILGMARAQIDLSQDKGGPLPAGTRLGGGPLENFARMVTNPIRFMASPSRSGPLGMAFTAMDRVGHGEPVDPAQIGGEMLQQYGGAVGNVLSGAFGLAYPPPGQQRGQLDLRDALFQWMTGKYIGKEPSPKAEQYFDTEEETGHAPRHFRRRHFQ